MKRLLREPLVHFLAIGALLFAAYARWGRGAPAGIADREIVVDPARIRHLAATFEQVWQRPPTREELQGLIDDFVREEVFVREALKLGLDQDDTVIRRRLRQKVEFLTDDTFHPPEPSDAELEKFLDDNSQWFTQDAEYTLRQVYFNTDRRGDAAATDAQSALARLRAGAGAVDLESLGDPFPLGREFPSATTTSLGRMFGDAFVKQLRGIKPGSWQGPVESEYGLHLVRIDSVKEGRLPALAEVRDAVLAEWTERKRAEANEEFYQSLKRQYVVTVQPGDFGKTATNVDTPNP